MERGDGFRFNWRVATTLLTAENSQIQRWRIDELSWILQHPNVTFVSDGELSVAATAMIRRLNISVY
ncbi:hypothetical protein GGD46_005996 [Rhizobium lusitanum]|uniref:Uncharacterized protein n=1 Tax=Rhizobium lusitanum TaxID=293958 RepID=A0A7X0MFN9_9HYPH|nr:hypothetical protein [Rhizobium lusitanum]